MVSFRFCARLPEVNIDEVYCMYYYELQQLHSMEFQVGEGSGLGGQMGVLGEERADGREISSDSNPLPRTTKGLFNRKVLFLLLTV